ncbi:MAG: alanyl-tRNA editing protein [Oscillospiraceae bacterium]|nr:alanyl-tRNA editing protein [Oscillospiraceae bacterium]
MKTEKLYYKDSHLQAFEAVVTGCAEVKKGWEITLDATAFYPEGGGQPSDMGILGDGNVLSVREDGEQVIHLCDKPLTVGDTVTGRIDWARRFDLMQQHSGEHMVSGVVHKLYGWHNVGFHMGAELITVDFDGPIPAEDLQKIEDTVNAAIWENLPVKCYYPTEAELPSVPYRRKKDLSWPVRIVEFPGIDICACCGTQVKHTGEIGLVKLFSCAKFHEGVRIEMACGQRALALLSAVYQQNRQVSQAFSAKILETGAAAARTNEALAAEKFRAAGLEKQLYSTIAKNYAGKAVAVHFEDALSPAANRALCDTLAGCCKIAVTLSGSDESGYSLCIVSQAADAKALGAAAVTALGGRGGGRREAFQGNTPATRQEICDFFQSQKII